MDIEINDLVKTKTKNCCNPLLESLDGKIGLVEFIAMGAVGEGYISTVYIEETDEDGIQIGLEINIPNEYLEIYEKYSDKKESLFVIAGDRVRIDIPIDELFVYDDIEKISELNGTSCEVSDVINPYKCIVKFYDDTYAILHTSHLRMISPCPKPLESKSYLTAVEEENFDPTSKEGLLKMRLDIEDALDKEDYKRASRIGKSYNLYRLLSRNSVKEYVDKHMKSLAKNT